MPIPCPGRCNEDTNTTTWGDPIWCFPCHLIAQKALRSMPQAYEALGSLLHVSKSVTYDNLRVTGSPSRPSPGPWVDMRDQIFHAIRTWEDETRQHLRHRGARDLGSREDTLASAVRYLNRNFTAVMSRDPQGREIGKGVVTLLETTLKMVKNGPIRRVLVIPCPLCHMKALVAREGVVKEPWFTYCEARLGGCGKSFTETEVGWMLTPGLGVYR